MFIANSLKVATSALYNIRTVRGWPWPLFLPLHNNFHMCLIKKVFPEQNVSHTMVFVTKTACSKSTDSSIAHACIRMKQLFCCMHECWKHTFLSPFYFIDFNICNGKLFWVWRKIKLTSWIVNAWIRIL